MRFGPVAKISLILLAGMVIVRAATIQEGKIWLSLVVTVPAGMSMIGVRLARLAETPVQASGDEFRRETRDAGASVQAALAETGR